MDNLDYRKQFEKIKETALKATEGMFPIVGKIKDIQATKIWVEDNLTADDYKSQKEHRLADKTWGVPVRADLQLTDKAGKVLEKEKGVRLFMLPKATDRMSFIVNGNEYQVDNQLRRRPGIYTIQRHDNNRSVVTEFNVAGKKFELGANDDDRVLSLRIKTSSVPLYPILSHMGISDSVLAKAWGEEILQANKAYKPQNAEESVKKAAKLLTGAPYSTASEASRAMREELGKLAIDPDVTKRTIGVEHSTISPETMVAASKNLVDIRFNPKSETKPVERDSLQYKQLMSVEDFLAERIKQRMEDNKRKFTRKLNFPGSKGTPRGIRDIVDISVIGPTVEEFFTRTDLSRNSEQTNPLQILNGISRVTIQGEGGVKQAHAITPEAKALHPTHMGYLDPIHTPESSKIGIITHLTIGARKSGNNISMPVIDVRTGKTVEVSPQDVFDSVVALPDQYDLKAKKFVKDNVKATISGEHKIVDSKDVRYVLQTPKQVFSLSTNMVPFLSSDSGGRALMASKMMEQAIPLTHREAPLVQTAIQNKTFEDVVGRGFSARSPVDGVVKSVGKNITVVTDSKGKEHEVSTYDNLPLNGKAFLHSQTNVKVGDKVKTDQILSDSNYTRGGTLALGVNLRTAYVPYKGYNFEDGIVITESAAKKLTSEHLHQKLLKRDPSIVFNKKLFQAKWPTFSSDQMEKLDDEGVARKGQTIYPGDPIIAAIRKTEVTATDVARGKANARLLRPERAVEEVWHGQGPGKVIDVVKGQDKIKIFIKTEEPATIGDKLTGRHGNKGIVTKIIPDNQAPRIGGPDGEAVDVMLNPTGVISRMNIGQMLETAVSKVADQTGKPIPVSNFSAGNQTKMVQALLEKHKLSDTEELFDHDTNRSVGRVFTGKQYIIKLNKQASTMFSARGWGEGYDINKAPLRGGEEGAKALDLLTLYSMLAHGSKANLKEMASIKSQQNDEFWRALEYGEQLPAPKAPFAYNKFISYLKGAGINVEETGSKKILVPMTDREVINLGPKAIKEPLFLTAKDLAPEPGGFFDTEITGGLPDRDGVGGDRWSHIPLAEPVPNPIMEGPIRHLLNLDKSKFDLLNHGRLYFDPASGQLNSERRGVTGGEAMRQMLKKINIDSALKDAGDTAKAAKSESTINKSNKTIRYLRALKESGMKADEAYIQTKLPVVPPNIRPVYVRPSGDITLEGLNRLYQHVGLVNQELNYWKDKPHAPPVLQEALRKDLYSSISALSGVSAKPLVAFTEKRIPKGFIQLIKGKGQAKEGFFQREVLRRNQDLVGRGTIIPEPRLASDEISLPQDMAWGIFKPFVIRKLVTRGWKPHDANLDWEKRGFSAGVALEEVMNERPVLLNRAPSLHKFSIMAFKSKIHQDPKLQAIKIPPLIVKGFNADFDGDAMTVHVPLLQPAVDEAWKMLPSRNIYNPGSGSVMLEPGQESVLGLNALSKDPDSKDVKGTFNTFREAESASARGTLKYNDMVTIAGKTGTLGRALINNHLPADVAVVTSELTKKSAQGLYRDIASKDQKNYANIVDGLRELGDHHAFHSGFTIGLSDVQPDLPQSDKMLSDASTKADHIRMTIKDPAASNKAIQALFHDVDAKVIAQIEKSLEANGNNFYTMVKSGARGNMKQLKQIVSAPVLVKDHRNQAIPIPILSNFGAGMPISDYWISLYGARSGAMDRQLQTEKPGSFNKYMMSSMVTNVITTDDCGDSKGLAFDLSKPSDRREVSNRYLASDVVHKGKVVAKKNELITPNLVADLEKHHVTNIHVRSPLTCTAPHGTCAMDYGKHDDGSDPVIGDNIGAISGQALSEPLTQLTMNTFHTGGVVGSGLTLSTFDKIDKLLRMQKRIPGKASLAEKSGRVDRVETAPQKGKTLVTIAGVEHKVPTSHGVLVRTGTTVEKGDPLTGGIIHPQELLKYKGMLPAMEYMAKEIANTYHDEGVPLRRRAVETVVRTIGSLTQVKDPGDSTFIPNEFIPYHVAEQFNRKAGGRKATSESEGHVLHEDVGPAKAGTTITPKLRKVLEDLGHTEIKVGPLPIIHQPQLNGIRQLPLMRKDWMAQMGYGYIAKALKEGVAERGESDIHSYSPIPAFAYGAEFGEGDAGAY